MNALSNDRIVSKETVAFFLMQNFTCIVFISFPPQLVSILVKKVLSGK